MNQREVVRLTSKARDAGRAEVAEIVRACTDAGAPELALGFVRDRKSVADVRQELAKRSWGKALSEINGKR